MNTTTHHLCYIRGDSSALDSVAVCVWILIWFDYTVALWLAMRFSRHLTYELRLKLVRDRKKRIAQNLK